MRIRVIQSGGIAGLRREREVDTMALASPTRTALEQTVERVRFFDLPPGRTQAAVPDAIQYRVRIVDAERSHEVMFHDPGARRELIRLAERVLAAPNAAPGAQK